MKWVLLRGLGRQIEHWHDFADLLGRHSNGILPIDLPGIGTNSSHKTPLSIAGHTDFLRPVFLNSKRDDEQWGIIGISLGGMITLDWISRFENDFTKAVIINSSSKDTGPTIQRLSIFSLYQSIRSLMAKDPLTREREIMKINCNMRTNDHSIIKKFAEIRSSHPVSPETFAKQLFAASQFMIPTKIKIPLLVLASLKDHMVDVRCSKQIANRLNSKIKIHPKAGHDLTLDDPEWALKQILEQDWANSERVDA